MKSKLVIGAMFFLFMSSTPIMADDDIPNILKSVDSVELNYDEKQLVRGERFFSMGLGWCKTMDKRTRWDLLGYTCNLAWNLYYRSEFMD